jgi:acetylornithine/N-succinyldiaminopimelate aminotransferase
MDPRTAHDLESRYLMPTYRRAPVVFVAGEGCYLLDSDGRRYLDFVSGIATVSLGHCHPRVVGALSSQASRLWHTSNLFYTEPQLRLAERLAGLTGWGKAFFASSGAEAIECALKVVRKYWRIQGEDRTRIVALKNSFHGRTLGALSLTGQPPKRRPFEPLLPEIVFVDPIDPQLESCGDGVGAVFVELVQAEGGVHPLPPDSAERIARYCSETGALLVVDEVQTGLCRTGSWFAWQHERLWGDLEPDVFTLGKALGNGIPISACIAKEQVAGAFEPGDHATTLGGAPLAAAVACEVLAVMEQERLYEAARRQGDYLRRKLEEVAGVVSVRGLGLLLAAEIETDAASVVSRALEAGLLLNAVGERSLRFAPPLVITETEIDEGVEILSKALRETE